MLYRLSYFRVRSANIRNLPNFHHHSANFYFLRPTSTINGPGHRCYTGKLGRTDTAYRKKRPSTTCGRPSPSDTVRETECKTGVSPTPVHCSAVGRSLRKTHGDTTVYGPLRCGRIGRHRRELFSEALGTDTVCRNPVLHEYRFDILRPFFRNSPPEYPSCPQNRLSES